MDDSDAELMNRWQGGDATAFDRLVRRWQQPMARFLTHLAGRAGSVADLCQEVFLRVFQAGPRYQENGAFATWLYRIALNVARDDGRRRRHAPESLTNGDVPARALPPEKVCTQQEEARLVTQALAELPEALRLVLVLRHYEDMSFEEMARLTATPASTLKSRFAAALVRLRERLHQLGSDPEDHLP